MVGLDLDLDPIYIFSTVRPNTTLIYRTRLQLGLTLLVPDLTQSWAAFCEQVWKVEKVLCAAVKPCLVRLFCCEEKRKNGLSFYGIGSEDLEPIQIRIT